VNCGPQKTRPLSPRTPPPPPPTNRRWEFEVNFQADIAVIQGKELKVVAKNCLKLAQQCLDVGVGGGWGESTDRGVKQATFKCAAL
jgi:hypothetical protein